MTPILPLNEWLSGGRFKLSRIVTRIDNPGREMPFRDTDLRQFKMHSLLSGLKTPIGNIIIC
jgi:hypothetical protein